MTSPLPSYYSLFHRAPIDSTAARAIRSSVAQSAPAAPTPPMHSPSTITGAPPSIAVQRSGPAASASPSACATSSACPCAPWDVVERRFEAAHTALVVAECTEWKRPPSMRSSRIRWPPASVIATDTAMPASRAIAVAVAIIILAPSLVSRLLSATYIFSPWVRRRDSATATAAPSWPQQSVIERRCESPRLRHQCGVERRHRLAQRHDHADRMHRLRLHDPGCADPGRDPPELG